VSRGPTDIEAYIARFAAPPADQLADFVAAGRSRALAPGEPFCRLGQERHELAFIHEGIVRYYVVLPDGDEATKDFSFAPSFTVSFGSAAAGRPAAVAIAAVTACRLSVWPYAAMLRFASAMPNGRSSAGCWRKSYMRAKNGARSPSCWRARKPATARPCARSQARSPRSPNTILRPISASGRSRCRGCESGSA
jgi:hypothetical protein